MDKRNKICVITAARSEYGPLRWVISEVENHPGLSLQLVVAGSHLSPEHGLTFQYIDEDGFTIDRRVEFLLSTASSNGIAKSMGLCAQSFADVFSDLQPDLIVILGDRYELLPICNTALVMNIPIAHISGGDITEGAIDNQIRNAVTMLSDLHFPGNESSKQNIIRMINRSDNVYNVGEPGLENFEREELINRIDLADSLQIDVQKKWILVTLHPETKCPVSESLLMAHKMMETLLDIEAVEIVITQANADLGGSEMNDYYKKCADKYPNVHLYKSLGQRRYLSFMNEAWCVIGNSSSGIIEAPFLGKPVINIGNRQKGRYICSNVIDIPRFDEGQIKQAIDNINYSGTPDYYYGDGNTSVHIVREIINYLSKRE